MCTSEINRRNLGKTALRYLAASIVCALFGAVYEEFSYGVYSYYMIYAFAIPLAGGALPFLSLAVAGNGRYPGFAARGLYHAGIAALTVGSVVQGILEIYGTTNRLVIVYGVAGIGLAAAGTALFLAGGFRNRRAGG